MAEKLTRRGFLNRVLAGGFGLYALDSVGGNPLTQEASKIALLNLFPSGIFPTEESLAIISKIHEKGDESVPWKMVKNNLYPVRDKIYVLPGAYYKDMFLRDYEHLSPFIDSLVLDENVLNNFESKQSGKGQIPTAVGIIGEAPYQYSDDESTLLYVISVARIAKENPQILTVKRKATVKGALGFIEGHVENGAYVSPAGSRTSHVDAFYFPNRDVISQNQGLYAVALLAAESLGFRLDPVRITEAINVYKNSANKNGFLPLSFGFADAPAIGSLYPEYLAIKMFGERFLTDQIVADSLALTPKSNYGHKILTANTKGDYFSPSNFINNSEKGKYQNGAVWLLWNSFALKVGEFHGITDNSYQQSVLRLLENSKYAESIRSGGQYELRLTPENLHYLWNLNIFTQFEV